MHWGCLEWGGGRLYHCQFVSKGLKKIKFTDRRLLSHQLPMSLLKVFPCEVEAWEQRRKKNDERPTW